MAKFIKSKIKPNQKYLKSWDKYQKEALKDKRHRSHPLLLPMSGDIADGVIVRDRIKANIVKEIWAEYKSELPDFLFDKDSRWAVPDPEKVFR